MMPAEPEAKEPPKAVAAEPVSKEPSTLPQPLAGIEGDSSRMLCLRGVLSHELPPMGDISGVKHVIQRLIQEAINVLASVDDSYHHDQEVNGTTGWKKLAAKTYKGVASTGGDTDINVDLMTRSIRAAGQEGAEPWACRRSYHDDAAIPGTASWSECYTYMKHRHVDTEKDMTPTVVAGNTVYEWKDVRDLEPLTGLGRTNSVWSDFTLAIVEMQHDLGTAFLSDRVFPVLQLTCQNAPLNEFYIISAPISQWTRFTAPEGYQKLADKKRTVVGSYASVEVFRRLPADESADEPAGRKAIGRKKSRAGELLALLTTHPRRPAADQADDDTPEPPQWRIEWTMATVSDARGCIPLSAQVPAIPGAIAKDVPLFTKWMAKRRRGVPNPADYGTKLGIIHHYTATQELPHAVCYGHLLAK